MKVLRARKIYLFFLLNTIDRHFDQNHSEECVFIIDNFLIVSSNFFPFDLLN